MADPKVRSLRSAHNYCDYLQRSLQLSAPVDSIMRLTILLLMTLALFSNMNLSRHSTLVTGARATEFDLIIMNGRVIDGSGSAAYSADVAIKGERIVKIGDLKNGVAARMIDAAGLIVAPGFIDMLGQSEANLLIDPRAMSKVMMGVTTEITGEGESIAPTNDRLIKENEDFNKRYNLTVDWRTLDQYFKRLEKQGMGLNLGTFVGATQGREYVVGFDNGSPTAAE